MKPRKAYISLVIGQTQDDGMWLTKRECADLIDWISEVTSERELAIVELDAAKTQAKSLHSDAVRLAGFLNDYRKRTNDAETLNARLVEHGNALAKLLDRFWYASDADVQRERAEWNAAVLTARAQDGK